MTWYDTSHLRYTRSLFATWLAEGYVRLGRMDQARSLLEDVLATCRELGYRHLEGIARRLLTECLRATAPAAATQHVREAVSILESVDAKNELAKAWLLATTFENDLVDSSRLAATRE